jgi:hypothetical protein
MKNSSIPRQDRHASKGQRWGQAKQPVPFFFFPEKSGQFLCYALFIRTGTIIDKQNIAICD